MNRQSRLLVGLFACIGTFTLFVGCERETATSNGDSAPTGSTTQPAGEKVAVAEVTPAQAATTQPVNNNVRGTVTFTQMGSQVKVSAHITGLEPNTVHGFHIHETGDLSTPDLSSAGGHYNPQGHQHAGPSTGPRHAGDLGNLTADASGIAMYEITVDNISIGGPTNDIIGKPVIIHAKADDLTSQPSGDAGARVAGGVIKLKQ